MITLLLAYAIYWGELVPRPKLQRQICGRPSHSCFKPNGLPLGQLTTIQLHADEFEALRLVDYLGLQQQQAAQQLGVSRQTLAIIVKSARAKVTDCLLNGKALMMNSNNKEPL